MLVPLSNPTGHQSSGRALLVIVTKDAIGQTRGRDVLWLQTFGEEDVRLRRGSGARRI